MNLLNSINNSMKQIEETLECVPAELKHWTADSSGTNKFMKEYCINKLRLSLS